MKSQIIIVIIFLAFNILDTNIARDSLGSTAETSINDSNTASTSEMEIGKRSRPSTSGTRRYNSNTPSTSDNENARTNTSRIINANTTQTYPLSVVAQHLTDLTHNQHMVLNQQIKMIVALIWKVNILIKTIMLKILLFVSYLKNFIIPTFCFYTVVLVELGEVDRMDVLNTVSASKKKRCNQIGSERDMFKTKKFKNKGI